MQREKVRTVFHDGFAQLQDLYLLVNKIHRNHRKRKSGTYSAWIVEAGGREQIDGGRAAYYVAVCNTCSCRTMRGLKKTRSSSPSLVIFGGEQMVLSAPDDERLPHDGGRCDNERGQALLPPSKRTPSCTHVLLARRARNPYVEFLREDPNSHPTAVPMYTHLVKPALPLSSAIPGLLAVNAVSFTCPLVFHRRKFYAVVAGTSALGTRSHGFSLARAVAAAFVCLSVRLSVRLLNLERDPPAARAWDKKYECMYDAGAVRLKLETLT